VALLLNQLKARARFRRLWNDRGGAGRDKRRKFGVQYEGKGVEFRHLVFIRTLDLPFARLVHMMVFRTVVMVWIQMGMDERSVDAIPMDVLKRRQNKGGCESQAALERDNPPHQQNSSMASARDATESR
jgi:hypothetical protein